jgi:hypothetical protein
MMGGQNKTPARGQVQPGQDGRLASAAGICKVRHRKGGAKAADWYLIRPDFGEPFAIKAKGRDAWALDRLIETGINGCTPIDQPAPRWSAYIFNLRALGVEITTVTERHGWPFAGNHGRYILCCNVVKLVRLP